MNVANKGVIRKLTTRFLKAARTRNIIAVIAIALTSVMFTSVFTLGGNMIATFQEQTMRQVGTKSHGGLKYLTKGQYGHFARSPLVRDIAYRKMLAVAENELLAKVYCEISYGEDKFADWGFALPTNGVMPSALNEAATSTIVLDTLGIPHEIGAEVPIEFTINGQKYSEVFTLAGYWTGDPAMMAQCIWVSEEYIDSVVPAYEGFVSADIFAGAVFADLWFNNSFSVESKILRLIGERGYTDGEIQFGVNWAYAMSGDVDPTMVAILTLVLVLILLSGYLITYSVFAISVKTDIHFYGLLKTIGTTGTQLRRIVRGQALTLSAIGIPIGLLLGYFSGLRLTPAILGMTAFSGSVQTNSASPLIFAFAAAFSLLTVFIGCRKPGKIAARVSPVEAVKYSGVSGGGTQKAKRTRKVTPLSMAWANTTREKRRLCVIVLSLSLALILLNSVVSATRSFDMDAYLSNMAISDFAVADATLYNPSVTRSETNGIRRNFLDELASAGITDMGCVYYYQIYTHGLPPRAYANFAAQIENERDALERTYSLSMPQVEKCLEEGWLPTQVYGVARLPLASFYPEYDRLASGNYALTVAHGIPVYDVGDKIALTNEAGESREFEIIGVVEEYPYTISTRFGIIPSQTIVLADNAFVDFFAPSGAMQVNFNVPEERLPEIESWIAGYTSRENTALGYISRDTLKAEFEGLRTTYLALGGAMAFILALIGVLNFINTIVASVIARRRELAMLQSVGMTGRQLRETLFFEGMCYTIMTAFFTLTAGLGLSWLIVRVIAGQTWFFREYFTVMPSVYCALPLFLVCGLVPPVCYRWLTRESLVERLRVE